MELSVCIIAKNEEKNIERCLKSLIPLALEIVVVDTGSVDATKAVARQYTPHVYDFKWCDDFAAAKNFALQKASWPFVLVLDCDESIQSCDLIRLKNLIMRHPGQVGRIQRVNLFTRNNLEQEYTEWLNRIFSRDLYCYRGKIHEQVESVSGGEYETYQAPVVICHTGYDLTPDEKQRKAKRNHLLLKQEYERLCSQSDEKEREQQLPYIIYQLGKSCYMAEDYGAATAYFSEGLSFDLNPRLEYVIDMVETYGYALLNSGRAKEALFFENIYDEFGGTADFKFLMGLIYMNNECFDQAVSEFLKAAEFASCRTKGVNSYSAFYNIGVIFECLGEKEKAREYYKKCGNYKPAVRQLAGL